MEKNQVVSFDPNKQEHRKDYAIFIETKSLGKCKNRYSLEGMYGDLVSMMTEKMINYYVNREFSNISKYIT